MSSGIEIAGTLLEVFSSFKIAEKAAFFVYDEREESYLPYAAIGYDLSSRNKMIFPEEKLKSLFKWDCESPFFAEKSPLLQQWFSRIEFDLLEAILLIPFIFDSEFLGFLMITQSDFLDDPKISVYSEMISETVSGLLFSKRFDPLRHTEGDIFPAVPDLRTQISELSERIIEEKKKIICLSFEIWMKSVSEKSPILSYCLKGDLLSIIGAMIAGEGKVIDRPGFGFLLLFPSSKMEDSELLIHQITTSCRMVFPAIGTDSDLASTVKTLEFDSTHPDDFPEIPE